MWPSLTAAWLAGVAERCRDSTATPVIICGNSEALRIFVGPYYRTDEPSLRGTQYSAASRCKNHARLHVQRPSSLHVSVDSRIPRRLPSTCPSIANGETLEAKSGVGRRDLGAGRVHSIQPSGGLALGLSCMSLQPLPAWAIAALPKFPN